MFAHEPLEGAALGARQSSRAAHVTSGFAEQADDIIPLESLNRLAFSLIEPHGAQFIYWTPP
jgi:hypothetical protein